MAALPPVPTEDAFTTVCRDEATLRPGVERLCQRLGVDVSGLTRFAVGSRPVYVAGDVVLKLFPPTDMAGCRVETGVLSAIDGRLPVPVPRVRAAGEHDGWGYVLMSRLPGVPLDTAWGQIPVRAAGTAAHRDHAPAPAGCREPGWRMAAVRAGRLRAGHAR